MLSEAHSSTSSSQELPSQPAWQRHVPSTWSHDCTGLCAAVTESALRTSCRQRQTDVGNKHCCQKNRHCCRNQTLLLEIQTLLSETDTVVRRKTKQKETYSTPETVVRKKDKQTSVKNRFTVVKTNTQNNCCQKQRETQPGS